MPRHRLRITKRKGLEEIDRGVYRTIVDVSKKIIGKAIDISTHEKLVMDALEKAKKEGIF